MYRWELVYIHTGVSAILYFTTGENFKFVLYHSNASLFLEMRNLKINANSCWTYANWMWISHCTFLYIELAVTGKHCFFLLNVIFKNRHSNKIWSTKDYVVLVLLLCYCYLTTLVMIYPRCICVKCTLLLLL